MATKKEKKAAGTNVGELKEEKKKSYTRLFWEKYPHGILEIVNMKAVLR